MRFLVAAALLVPWAAAWAAEVDAPSDAAAMHPEAEQALKLFKLPPGLKIEPWATEPLLANPVAFGFDERGGAYVVETYRHTDGALDNRGRMDWLSEAFKKSATPERMARVSEEILDRELASRTVEDRAALVKAYMDLKFMTAKEDRLVLVRDSDGDGRADKSTVFAGGFKDPIDGLPASVLARKGDVYFTNIPHLWLLRDRNGDGVADDRKSLHRGFGVRYAFIGHDLHGLRVGPDGRLYFSIGDRGAHVVTPEGRTIAMPDTGSVFRCELDGSKLEVFASGLRNPQDLVFDEHGNLFTGDNNSDGGDKARWVYLVEGGDSGWRIGYQYLPARGPWNAEKLWYPAPEGQAASQVPPIYNITNGPSGLAYYPGTGLPKAFAGRYFLVDFKGQDTTSGVWSFTLRPKGASFELLDPQKAIWGMLATDVEFGVDGALYVLDWLQGWKKPGKGRIWRIHDPAMAKDPEVLGTRKLIGEGMAKRPEGELGRLLGHPDIRVRQEAQLELAARRSVDALLANAQTHTNRLARLHGLWGLGQIIRSGAPSGIADKVIGFLDDKDPEVRAQAAKVLGDVRAPAAYTGLLTHLEDASPRVQFFSAIGLGRLGRKEAASALIAFLRRNADRDLYLRHAAVMGLVGSDNITALLSAAGDSSRSVRLGVLLALRRLKHPEVARFVKDSDPALVREAARAINDETIEPAMAALAAVRTTGKPDAPTLLRVVNANFRLGTAEGAGRLAALARQPSLPAEVRAMAIGALGDWAAPSGRDRITGNWRPVSPAKRDAKVASDALGPSIAADRDPAVLLATVGAVGKLRMPTAAPFLTSVVTTRKAPGRVRAEALRALSAIDALGPALEAARRDPDPAVRVEVLQAEIFAFPDRAPELLDRAMAGGSVREQQAALGALARVRGPQGEKLLLRWMEALLAGKIRPEIVLDLLEAARRSRAPAVQERLTAHADRLAQSRDEMAPYQEALAGGDPDEGRKIFQNKAQVSCLRCHAVAGLGADVGPDLAGIAKKRNRQYLLESVVKPNKHMAAGFESVVLTLKDGSIRAGVLRKETPAALEVVSPEAGRQVVPKAEVKKRDRGASGMPDGLGDILTRRELRDLIEYLAQLK